jgi:hypothetical protein
MKVKQAAEPKEPEEAKPYAETGVPVFSKVYQKSILKDADKGKRLVVGTVGKTHSSQVRVSIATWRGQRKVELHECTAIVDGVFFPVGGGVKVNVEQFPELLAILNGVPEMLSQCVKKPKPKTKRKATTNENVDDVSI